MTGSQKDDIPGQLDGGRKAGYRGGDSLVQHQTVNNQSGS
jgi:hypothetical protein